MTHDALSWTELRTAAPRVPAVTPGLGALLGLIKLRLHPGPSLVVLAIIF
eukprot:COSAG02_NODE_1814_length_10782_cov_383.824862_10_plen_50_part_00